MAYFKLFEAYTKTNQQIVNEIIARAEEQLHLLETLANEMGLEVYDTYLPKTYDFVELWLKPDLKIKATENYTFQNNTWEYTVYGNVPYPHKAHSDPKEAMLMAQKYYTLK